MARPAGVAIASVLAALALVLGVLAGPVALAVNSGAASATPIAANLPIVTGPPYPSPNATQSVYNPNGIIRPATVRTLQTVLGTIGQTGQIQLIVYVETAPKGMSAAQATANAAALVTQWKLNRSVLLLLSVASSRCDGQASLVRGTGVTSASLPDDSFKSVISDDILPALRDCDPDTAAIVGASELAAPLILAGSSLTPPSPGTSAAPSGAPASPGIGGLTTTGEPGPPYPDPVDGRYVYDTAGVFRPDTIATVQKTIEGIRERTGAQVAVYTQVKPGVDTDEAESDAQALMDQWGVGRKGFDDGLVILFDLDETLKHGQVQLYAGPGYDATFLSNSERQSIYENDMLPLLREGDLDGALLVAMQKVDANATPEHAATLEQARQLNAVIGLVGAPLVFLLLVGWALWSWLRYGRDPHYLDDPSILMPAPPADLTAASGALVFDGKSSRHTLTTAMLDLASRGEIAFRPEEHTFGADKMGIDITDPDESNPRTVLNRRAPEGPAEQYALTALEGIADRDSDGVEHIDSKDLLTFGPKVEAFDNALESHVVAKGWFREKPKSAVTRWVGRGVIEIIVAVIAGVIAVNLPSDGLVLLASAVGAAGVFTLIIARAMPARTLSGATIRAMLAAYKRTLQKTLEQSRSMDQVVESKALPWLVTPDQAVVWGVALGLHGDIEKVLDRTADDLKDGRANLGTTYLPLWYGPRGNFVGGGSVGGGGFAPGLMSGSAIPNFGNMMGAIGTIGNSPSSSGGGGFGGGGSGGGGGGAGGGF